jgi:hypothetical protein
MGILNARVFIASAEWMPLVAAPLLAGTQTAPVTCKAECIVCHGAGGKGDSPITKALGARDFASADVQKETDAELTAIIAQGGNKMPLCTCLPAFRNSF